MPVEFRCTGCSNLLRTPDESAGKKAQCPQCGEVVDVPRARQSEDEARASEPTGGSAVVNPFGDPTAVTDQRSESANPYAAPAISEGPRTTHTRVANLEHHIISFEQVLRKAWMLTKLQLVPIALSGIVYLPIVYGLQTAREQAATMSGVLNDPFFQIGGPLALYVVEFCVTTYLQLGFVIFGLRLARTGTARVSDLFAAGPFYLRGLGLFLLITLIYYGAMVICLIPAFAATRIDHTELVIPAFFLFGLLAFAVGMYAFVRMALATEFLVDRDIGVIESLRLSSQFMAGNKWTTFLLTVVTLFVGGIASLATCCIGVVVLVPFVLGILYPTVYLMATGQPMHDTRPRVQKLITPPSLPT